MSFNLNEEVIDGHLVTAETKKLWAVEMDLAQKILEVCKKYHLNIWAEGGTLLGAVRHKGFIPWDDDIDFVMMRDDYEELLSIAPKEFSEPYFLQTFDNDNGFSGIAKLRRSDTAMIDTSYQSWKPRHYGIFVDIIVMDAVPDDDKKRNALFKKINVLERLISRKRVFRDDYSSFRSLIRTLAVNAFFFFNGGVTHVQHKLVNIFKENLSKPYRYCGKVEVDTQCDYVKKVQLRERVWYNETIELPFQDMVLPVPKEYDKILRSQFGDYMIPVKGRSWHEILVIDTERSYKTILEELKNGK